MDIKEMKKQIEEKCDERWRENTGCNGCPLHNRYICFNTDDYDVIKENYELMFPKEEKKRRINMDENYAVINGEKIKLDDEIIKVIIENKINYKKYNIGHIEIKPNWSEGYIKDSDEQDEGAIYIGDDDNSMCITHKELPEIIEALIEINSYITKRKGEN